MNYFQENWVTWALGIFLVGLIWFAIWGSIEDAKQFQRYAIDHHCVVSGKKEGQMGLGINMGKGGGVVPTYTPSQAIYRCDGDEIIIR